MTGQYRTLILIGALVLIAATGVSFLFYKNNALWSGTANSASSIAIEDASAVITRTDTGYEPREVTIHVGETVLFVNESDDFHWPASNVHPTHRIYSEFDPLHPIPPGENWSFMFTRKGEWKFHDHLRANYTGTITVIE